jgi:hypothetical protein
LAFAGSRQEQVDGHSTAIAARTGATSSRQKSTNVEQARTFGRFIRAPPREWDK